MSNGWLDTVLDAYVAAAEPGAVESRVAMVRRPWTRDVASASKRWLYWSLYRRGIAYGLPLSRPTMLQEVQSGSWSRAFTPFLATWCDLVVEVEAIVLGQGREERLKEWLLCCLAALVGQDRLAGTLWGAAQGDPAPKRLLGRACRGLEKRLRARRYLASNPLLGLPLRNGFVYSDARLVGRLALKIAIDQGVDPTALKRLRSFAQRERRLLAAALCGMVASRGEMSGRARRIAAGQLGRAGLPSAQVRTLKRLLTQPPSVAEIAALAADRRAPGYLVQQLALAAVIDGRLDAGERAFLNELAGELNVPSARVGRIEWRVQRFVEFHRDFFDLFTETQYYGQLEAVFYQRVVKLVLRNLDALVTEIRQTGELAALLTKAGAGQRLTDDERAKVREQLLDIMRAIPSLALFTLPGGALLLPIVLKLLPWDLRPSAFREAAKRRD